MLRFLFGKLFQLGEARSPFFSSFNHKALFISRHLNQNSTKHIHRPLTKEWNNKIPASLKAEIAKLSKDIAAGNIIALNTVE